MRRIRDRTRVDTLSNQHRTSPARWGRRVYFGLLLGLGATVADWAVGDALFLRADGLVIADRAVAGATYTARVARVLVREGALVGAGDVIAELESADMLRDIAQVSAQNADLSEREVRLRTRVATLDALLPLAERHARESAGIISQLDRMSTTGLVSSQRLDQALSSQYDAAARLVGLRAEASLLATELPLVMRARIRAAQTLEQLESFYDQGRIRAPRSGTMGPRVPVQGQVVRPGDELLQIHGRATSVLAYLPDTYMFAIRPEDRLTVTVGSTLAEGLVEAVLPVTDALPPEFQSMFRPRDRGRLVRIRLPAEHGFAVAQKVRVRGCSLGLCWDTASLQHLAALLSRQIGS